MTFPVFADVPVRTRSSSRCSGARPSSSLLAMARHLRVFAATTPGHGPARAVRPDRRAARRPDRVRVRPDEDVPRLAGRPHARGDLLGLRAADDRDGERRHRRADPDDPVDPVRRPALDAISAMQNVVAVIVLAVDRLGVRGGGSSRAAAADVQPRRAGDPGDDRRRRPDGAAGGGLRVRRVRRPARRVRLGRARGAAARGAVAGRRSRSRSRSCGGLHIVLVAAFLVYLPLSASTSTSRRLPEHLVPQARAARRAAGDGPRARGRDVRPEVAPGPRLEGPARRLHLHRVRPLPAGLPGLEHRQAAQPQDVHHGHPGHVGRGGARPRPDPELADRPRDVRPRRRDAAADADGAGDRRRRDPVRRGLGLRDLRRLRRGLPGADRARRQDRRAAPEPRPRGVALPGRS